MPDRDNSLSKTINLGANLLLSSRGTPLRVWAGAGLDLRVYLPGNLHEQRGRDRHRQ